jgi:putative oxidoreductase
MRAVFVFGRAIFGGFFLLNGLHHFREQEQMSGYAASKGVPAPEVAITSTGAMLVAGGLSVIAGMKPRQGLAALVAFLIPVSVQMHRFWEIDDPAQRANEMAHFMKNMALVGAALMLMQVGEPWPASLDRARLKGDEMYVRLGGRELRALPA